MFVSEIYAVEDCWKYDSTSHQQVFNTSSREVVTVSDVPNGDVEIICTLNSNKRAFGLLFGKNTTFDNFTSLRFTGGNSQMLVFVTSEVYSTTSSAYTVNTDVTIKFVRDGTTVKVYQNDVLFGEYTVNWFSELANLLIESYDSSKTISYKDLKIKPL